MTVSPDYTNVEYILFGDTDNGNQTFNLYTPQGTYYTKPAAGWPCVVYVNMDSWTTSTKPATITGRKEQITQWGMALCDTQVTTDGVGDGNGLFRNPGSSRWNSDHSPEHDLVNCIQHIRDNAATYNIDKNNIGVFAVDTEASTVALWVAMLEEQAIPVSPDTQLRQSSVVNTCCVRNPTTWWFAMADTETVPGHLPDATLVETVAATYGDANSGKRWQASPIYRPTISSTPPTMPVRMTSSGAPTNTDFRTRGNLVPKIQDVLTSETEAWHQIMMLRWLRTHVSSVTHAGSSVVSDAVAGIPYADEILPLSGLRETADIQFLASTLGVNHRGLGTFPIPHDWAIQMSTMRVGIQSGREGGVSHRRQTQSSHSVSHLRRSRRTWGVKWTLLTKAERDTLLTFWNTVRGNVSPFNFSPPDEAGKVLVRLVDSEMATVNPSHDTYQGTATVQERVV